MKKHSCIVILSVSLVFTACNTKSKNKKEDSKSLEVIEAVQEENNRTNTFQDIWQNMSLKSTPVIDSTNFNTVRELNALNPQEIKILQLSKMYPNLEKEVDHYKFLPSYTLELSDAFYTIVLNVFKGDHELETILINYDSDHKLSQYYNEDGKLISNSLVIAYDEIAEGWSRKYSKIEKQVITVTDVFYGDPMQIDTTRFQITRSGQINQIKTKFSSVLRPDQAIVLDKTYTDTIEFLTYNDDYDYRMIEGKKNNKAVSLLYNWDRDNNDKYNFKYGDLVQVEWKMDRIIHAGDEEIVDFKEWAIDVAHVLSKNQAVKFLWRADKFDEEINQEVSSIFINESFLHSISDQEKAALGFVATFIGNECSWDGSVNEDRSNLTCKIVTALDLGYQCSEQHLGFLRNWFSKDPVVLKKLAVCATMPDGATVQTTFDEISIITNKNTKTISVIYKVQGINMRESKTWYYTQTDYFEYTKNTIKLVDSEKSEVIEKISNDNPDADVPNAIAKANTSFVISCGSGCAMTYTEYSRIKKEYVIETVFKVEMYTNEKRIEEYFETYEFSCVMSTKTVQIKLKGDSDFKIENQHPKLQENLILYLNQLCK